MKNLRRIFTHLGLALSVVCFAATPSIAGDVETSSGGVLMIVKMINNLDTATEKLDEAIEELEEVYDEATVDEQSELDDVIEEITAERQAVARVRNSLEDLVLNPGSGNPIARFLGFTVAQVFNGIVISAALGAILSFGLGASSSAKVQSNWDPAQSQIVKNTKDWRKYFLATYPGDTRLKQALDRQVQDAVKFATLFGPYWADTHPNYRRTLADLIALARQRNNAFSYNPAP